MNWKSLVSILMVFSLLTVTVSALDPIDTSVDYHEILQYKDDIVKFIDDALDAQPFLGHIFGNTKANIYVDGLDADFHIVTVDNKVQSADIGLLDDPNINIYTDSETLNGLRDSSLSPLDAVKNGKIRWEGADFIGGIVIGVLNFFMGFFL